MELSKILIGAMRFKDRDSAVATVRRAIDRGFNYIDTSPCYCRKSEEENSESWVGEAVRHPDYRGKVMVSTKCSPGNGGLLLGDFKGESGFGVRNVKQLDRVFDNSLRRTGLDRFDYYHLWTVHTREQFDEAMKPGGWYKGVKRRKHQWDHLGVTTHADGETIISFLESGVFQAVTLPYNIINTTRRRAIDYALQKGITVIAMNPFAGGFLAADERIREIALRYLMVLNGVHPLIGFESPEEVEYAAWIRDTMDGENRSADDYLKEISTLMNTDEPRCTACGYCLPCPENINIGASLSYYNMVKYLDMREAKKAFLDKQWEDGLRLDRCRSCGQCESRCPNNLPVVNIIDEARDLLYERPS